MAAPSDRPQASWREPGYATLYSNIALFPELGRFRRFAGEWAKLLHDDTEEILLYQGKVGAELRDAMPAPSGVNVWDIPRTAVQAQYPDIYNNSWKPYEQALRQYGTDFCTSQQIVAQAGQARWATKYLSRFKEPVFENGKFGPTQEPERFYLGPSETHDSCAWRVTPSQDFLAERIFAMVPWIEDHILRYFRNPRASRSAGACENEDPETPQSTGACETEEADPPYIRYHRLVETVDVLTCIFISVLLTSAIFVLKSIKSWDSRGGVVGALGSVFSVAVKFLAGGPSRRIEVYAATAAFFAVVSVFVSNSNN